MFKDKKVLITGATGGIGGAIVKQFHDAGAIVAISGTRAEKLQEIVDNFNDKRIFAFPCDLADVEAVKKLAKDAESAMNGLDILICNAGVTKDNLAMRMSDDDWLDVISINMTSTFALIKASLRGMMKRRYGRIINIGSIVGTMGNAGQANYVASKAGIVGLSKSIAAEVATRGITVNCIAPGFISTAMTDKLTEDQVQKMAANIPSGKFGVPEDIASAAAFLAGESASYITGQTLHVNGGMLMV